MDTIKVLCITGWCRNGSTIIGNVLNEMPGFFHVGELHFLWKNGAGKGVNNLCGCGAALTECPIWSEILTLGKPAGVTLPDFAATVIRRQRACVRTRHTWRVLRRGPGSGGGDIRAHADLMTRTYHAAAERTGARVIVDTTKIPGEAALLPYLEGITPYFVHLVRDPRAVAHSWRQPKQYVYAMSSWMSTAYWHGFNLASHAITRRFPQRSLFLRYEDFTTDPEATIDTLLRLCGADPAANPVRDRTVDLHTNHTVTGNPDRFRTGVTVIRERDDGWRDTLTLPARLAAVTLATPLFRRYGYSYGGTLTGGARPKENHGSRA
ncbi:sulfotransferase [Nonomuraea sp. SBT364]|uniref:sulfotransferase n=1 Tax=Nonomuraea sp. SBT364 TaxID=1580530 RepID=UPI00066CDC19|nr:sulfotransferase [Nonomuraea sp. SBT364]